MTDLCEHGYAAFCPRCVRSVYPSREELQAEVERLRAELAQWQLGSATVNERLLAEIERLREALRQALIVAYPDEDRTND